ncbi:hypothetical protein Tco_0157139 [Tanacetum coccineum]
MKARFKISPQIFEDHTLGEIISLKYACEHGSSESAGSLALREIVGLKIMNFIILDMPEDVKVPLILGRPFLSTAHAKIDVFKRKITEGLRERMELDLEAKLMGETLVLNRSLDPLHGDYIELNDLNVPLELRRDQVDDLMPTIEEGEKIWMAAEIKTWEISFLENHSAKLHVWSKKVSPYGVFQFMDTAYWSPDLARKEINKVGEVSIIWNPTCVL